MEDNTIVTIVGLLGAIVSVVFVGLIWLIKEQFKQSNTTLKDGAKASEALSATIANLDHTINRQLKAEDEREISSKTFQKSVMQNFDKQSKNLDKLTLLQDKILKTQDRNYEAVINQKVSVQEVGKQIVKKEG